MNRAGLRCGLALTAQYRTISQAEADIAFKLGNNLMKEDYAGDISFPIFVLLADMYKTYSLFDVPLDSGFVSKTTMLRHLSEMDMPHRFTPESISEVFNAINEDNLQFYKFS